MLTLIIPARNEAPSLKKLLPTLVQPDHKIIVVNDGSEDDTADICKNNNIECITISPTGNGGAIKAGLAIVTTEFFAIVDADGQHSAQNLEQLKKHIKKNTMIIGARTLKSQASIARASGNFLLNLFASLMLGKRVKDLTSGLRIVPTEYAHTIKHLLPDGFSTPTTLTMLSTKHGIKLHYVRFSAAKRIGTSHLNFISDGLKICRICAKIAFFSTWRGRICAVLLLVLIACSFTI